MQEPGINHFVLLFEIGKSDYGNDAVLPNRPYAKLSS